MIPELMRGKNLGRGYCRTPTVGVSNRHKVAIATDSLSIRATIKLLPPTRSVTLTTTNRCKLWSKHGKWDTTVSSALAVSHGALPCTVQHRRKKYKATQWLIHHLWIPIVVLCSRVPVPGSAMPRPMANYHINFYVWGMGIYPLSLYW